MNDCEEIDTLDLAPQTAVIDHSAIVERLRNLSKSTDRIIQRIEIEKLRRSSHK